MEFSKLRSREAVAAMLLGVEQARQDSAQQQGKQAFCVQPCRRCGGTRRSPSAQRRRAQAGVRLRMVMTSSRCAPVWPEAEKLFTVAARKSLCQGRAWWPSSGARNKRAHALNGNTARRDQTRGTFPNQWNSCWLAATLQSLFAAGRVRQAVSSHVGCGAAACGMCLLRKTEAESRSAGAEVVLCQDWAKPLRAFGCPLGPQQDPAEFVAQLVGLLGPKWLQVAGVQRTEVKALVPQCSCYGANLVETSRITAAETCINLYLPDASSTAEQSLNDLLRDNTLSARASGQRCPLCLQDITQREQTTYGCEDVLVFNVVREHGRKPVRADKVTLPDRMWPDEANTEYELRAVVCRSGASADSGHYVAFVRGAGSSWICYDDGVADAKRQPQLEMQRACRLIVYERTCETVKTEQPDRAPLPSTSSQWPHAGLVPDAVAPLTVSSHKSANSACHASAAADRDRASCRNKGKLDRKLRQQRPLSKVSNSARASRSKASWPSPTGMCSSSSMSASHSLALAFPPTWLSSTRARSDPCSLAALDAAGYICRCCVRSS